MKAGLLAMVALAGWSLNSFGYGLGVSTHPLEDGKKLLNGELTGVVSNGTGMGAQFRYVQRIQEKFTLDAGLGLAAGQRSNRIFAGMDTMIFPDYKYQPRTSVRAYYENAREFGSRHNILGLAPTVSKGFSFWEKEAYPFLSLPMELNLDSNSSSYRTAIRLSLGLTAPLTFKEGQNLVANVEANLNLKSSYTGFFAGVSYPFN